MFIATVWESIWNKYLQLRLSSNDDLTIMKKNIFLNVSDFLWFVDLSWMCFQTVYSVLHFIAVIVPWSIKDMFIYINAVNTFYTKPVIVSQSTAVHTKIISNDFNYCD